MRIKRKDWSLLDGSKLYSEYNEYIKSKATQSNYRRVLILFLSDVKLSFDEVVDLGKKDSDAFAVLVKEYVLRLKARYAEEKLSGSSVLNYTKPIRLMTDVFDIHFNWKKLNRILPYSRKASRDSLPPLDDIRKMYDVGDQRIKFILSTMVSGGLRVGAWSYLDVEDITSIERYGQVVAGKVVAYRGFREQYFTFISPEAWRNFNDYLDMRRKAGEVITDKSPALGKVQLVSKPHLAPMEPKDMRLTLDGIRSIFHRAYLKVGLRWEGRRNERYNYKMLHGFRKFFKTNCEQVMKPINVETLLGHSIGISDSYYRPTEENLLDDYLKAIPLLSISVEEKLQKEMAKREELEQNMSVLIQRISNLEAKLA